MMKQVLYIILLCTLAACNSNTQKQTTTQPSSADNKAVVKETPTWSYEIKGDKIGTISTKDKLSSLPSLLPKAFLIEKDSLFYGTSGEASIAYFIYEEGQCDLRVFPNVQEEDEIYSIEIVDKKYWIADTHIKIGSTVEDLKKVYTIKDLFFETEFGLFIYFEEFNGVFEIDFEGNLNDEFLDFIEKKLYLHGGTLLDRYKIKSIAIH